MDIEDKKATNDSPSLIANSVTFDNLFKLESDNNSEISVNEMIKKMEEDTNIKTTETDMGFHLFANVDKLVKEEDRVQFEKQEDNKSEQSYKQRDSLDDLIKSAPNDTDNVYNTQVNTVQVDTAQVNTAPVNTPPKITKEEEMLQKLDMLRKLGELHGRGVKLSQNYNMNSDYNSMKYEYELHTGIRDKQNGLKWMCEMFTMTCKGVELANDSFNPFDFKMDGWADYVNDDIDKYYDVLGELYEKYFRGTGKVAPEMKLAFLLGSSAFSFQMQRSVMSSIPTLSNMMNGNPELVEKLRQQAVQDKMKKRNQNMRDSLNNAMEKEHDIARKNASDIEMLKRQEQMMAHASSNQMNKNSIFTKYDKLQQLQNQLDAQMSETELSPADRYELTRQQQIMEHQKSLQQRFNRAEDTPSHDGESVVNINPQLNSILNRDKNSTESSNSARKRSAIRVSTY